MKSVMPCLEDQQQNKHSNTSNMVLDGGFNPFEHISQIGS